MNVEDFFPKYPNRKRNEEFEELNFYADSEDEPKTFEQILYDKKEFRDLQLSSGDNEKQNEKDILFKHQKVVSRFLSNYTPYDGLLLFHEMGTGKTCAAFGTVENLRDTKDSKKYKKAFVIMPNDIILKNNMLELAKTCTNGKYMPTDREDFAPKKIQAAIRKRINDFYVFETLGVFTKNLKTKTDELIRKEYSNSIIIVDEIHNSVVAEDGVQLEQTQTDTYNQLHRMLHLVTNCKKILMTGTPMKDRPGEIALICNLLLPLDNQFPSKADDFEREYMRDVPGTQKKKIMLEGEKTEEFKSKIKGYVSYLKSSMTSVKTNFVVSSIPSSPQIKNFKIFVDKMDLFQSQVYFKVKEGEFELPKKEASLFVYPDKTYGSEGFNNYFKEVKKGKYSYRQLFKVGRDATDDEKLKELRKYSSIYASTIQKILDNPKKNTLVFNSIVHGSGSVLFARILEYFNFEVFQQGIVDSSSPRKRRFALITSETLNNPSAFRSIRQVYNDPRNKNGDFLQIIIFSRVASEGISFKNVQEIHIQTPHWNYAETSQAIARGLRANSHKDLVDDGVNVTVHIYQHCAVPEEEKTKTLLFDSSVQFKQYVFSEEKDSSIKSVERLIKEAAVDCQLFYKKNKFDMDGSRECDYMPCDYTCDGITDKDGQVTTTNTYDLYYSQANVSEIIERIKNLFRYRFSFTLDELLQDRKLSTFTFFEVLSSLRKIIGENIVIINKYFFENYLREQGDVYYLVEKLHISSDFCSSTYAENPIGFVQQSLERVFKQYEESLKEDLLRAETQEEANSILSRFTTNGQKTILESVLIPQSTVPDVVKTKIITYFQSGDRELQVKIVGTPASGSIRYEINNQIMELQADGVWKKIALKSELDFRLPTKTIGGYIGLYNANDRPDPKKFLIQNWDETVEKIQNDEEDTRKIPVGQVCKTVKGLGNILVSLKVPIPEEGIMKIKKDPYLRERCNFDNPTEKQDKENRKHLFKLLSETVKPELIRGYYSEESSIDLLFRAYYFNRLKAQDACDLLFKIFEENGCLYKNWFSDKTYGKDKRKYAEAIKKQLQKSSVGEAEVEDSKDEDAEVSEGEGENED
jgi:superfamily II DNA or RNA helicase